MLRLLTLELSSNGVTAREAARDELASLLTREDRIVWVDLHDPTVDEARVLVEQFRFHPAAVEDALEEMVHPKIDDYGDYLYVVLHGILDEKLSVDGSVGMHEVDFFLGRRFLVTHHDKVSRSVQEVWDRTLRQPDLFRAGPDMLFQAVVERMIDRYLPIIEQFDERVDRMEEEIFSGHADASILERIFGYKRSALTLRRTVHPQREVVRNLSGGGYALLSREAQIQMRGVHDHLYTIAELIDSYRDLITGALEAHLSVTSNKLNQVMKRLTLITTTLMPIATIAGIYGMNVSDLPLAPGGGGFTMILALMAALGVVTVAFLKWKRWT